MMTWPVNQDYAESVGVEGEICFGSACKYVYGQRDIVGAGAFGTIHRAVITDIGDYMGPLTVAVKTIYFTKRDEINRFINGAKNGAFLSQWEGLLQLNHPNVVHYYKITVFNNTTTASVEFMMDLLQGGDLDALLEARNDRKRDLSLPAILCCGVQITEGLRYLHDRNIIHADLKPANILLNFFPNSHPTVVISDLDDLVLMQQNVTCTADFRAIRGSKRYMSPEMLKKFVAEEDDGAKPPGRKTDIWSLGCVLLDLASQCFEIKMRTLCKINPQSGGIEKYIVNDNTNENVFMMKITDGFTPLVHEAIPRSFADVILSCLSRDVEKRASSEELQSKLRDVAHEYRSVIQKSVTSCEFCLRTGEIPNKSAVVSEPNAVRQCLLEGDIVLQSDFGANKTAAEKTIPFNESHVLFIHEFHSPGTIFVTIRTQIFDAKKRTLWELVLPYTDLHCNCFVPSSFIFVNNRMICQAVASLASETIVIVSYNFDNGTWHRMHTNLARIGWWKAPVVIGNKVYHWSRVPLQVSKVRQDKIEFILDSTTNTRENWAAASHIGSTIFLFGGLPIETSNWMRSLTNFLMFPFYQPSPNNGLRTAKAYDTVTHRQEPLPDVFGLRENCAFAVLDHTLYVMGGDSHKLVSTNSCMRLHGDGYSENISALRRPRTHHGAFTFEGCVYVYGGHHLGHTRGTTLSQIMEVYNPESNLWTDFPFTNTDQTDFADKAFRHTSCFRFQDPAIAFFTTND